MIYWLLHKISSIITITSILYCEWQSHWYIRVIFDFHKWKSSGQIIGKVLVKLSNVILLANELIKPNFFNHLSRLETQMCNFYWIYTSHKEGKDLLKLTNLKSNQTSNPRHTNLEVRTRPLCTPSWSRLLYVSFFLIAFWWCVFAPFNILCLCY